MDQAVLTYDIGGTYIRAALIGNKGILIARKFAWHAERNSEYDFNYIVNIGKKLLFDFNIEKINCISLSTAANINSTGIVISWSNRKSWVGHNLIKVISEKFSEPRIFFEEDANCGAIAEQYFGCYNNLLYVTIGTGIGSGLILQRKIYKGTHGIANELGHMIINKVGRKCLCGRTGCLQTIAAGSYIQKKAENMGYNNISTFLNKSEENKTIRKIVVNSSNSIAFCVSNIVNYLDINPVIISSRFISESKIWWESLKYAFYQNSNKEYYEIKSTMLGDFGSLLGSAILTNLKLNRYNLILEYENNSLGD